MLTIRFNRIGKKNKAYFRIVLQEHTVAPGGRHIEVLGSWDPHLKKGVFKVEKIKEWIKKGAQVSDSVWNLLIKQGIIEGKKRIIKIAKSTESKTGESKIEAGKAGISANEKGGTTEAEKETKESEKTEESKSVAEEKPEELKKEDANKQ